MDPLVDPKSRRRSNWKYHPIPGNIPGTRQRGRLRESGCSYCIPRLGIREARERWKRKYAQAAPCFIDAEEMDD